MFSRQWFAMPPSCRALPLLSARCGFALDQPMRGLDNLLAASKSIIDGMAHALGVDDSRFKPILVDSVYAGGEGCLMAAVGIQIVSGVSL